MKEDFAELIEYLDGKFTNIDSKFTNIDGNFIDIDNKLENLKENKADKSDVRELINSVDAYAKKADTYFQEMVMLAHKVDKMEKWIHQIAEKVGLKLEQ